MEALLHYQFVMLAAFDDLLVVKHKDHIGIDDGA